MQNSRADILIVDDDTALRSKVSDILTESGYGVRTSADGFCALTEIRRQVPDVLLSDLEMPGMSGFELLSIVRRRFPIIRVIAMSGAYAGEEVPHGLAADAFYEKGMSGMARLLQMLSAIMNREQPFPREDTLPIWIS